MITIKLLIGVALVVAVIFFSVGYLIGYAKGLKDFDRYKIKLKGSDIRLSSRRGVPLMPNHPDMPVSMSGKENGKRSSKIDNEDYSQW